jgi:hypothetical protein
LTLSTLVITTERHRGAVEEGHDFFVHGFGPRDARRS